jgi:hypothetical protein
MKTETNSTLIENNQTKQIWTEPTLTTVAVSIETMGTGGAAGDGGTHLT